MIVTTLNAILGAHSGINWLSNTHDDHHLKFNINYGTGCGMDWLFGTSK